MTKIRTENLTQLVLTLSNRTLTVLKERGIDVSDYNAIGDAFELQKIARALHKLDERACNEDLTCRYCDGAGRVVLRPVAPIGAVPDDEDDCRKCAGSGLSTGKREASLVAKARAIAAAYGFRLYVQGDPRGWPLYLIPDTYPATEDGSWYSSRGLAVCPQ